MFSPGLCTSWIFINSVTSVVCDNRLPWNEIQGQGQRKSIVRIPDIGIEGCRKNKLFMALCVCARQNLHVRVSMEPDSCASSFHDAYDLETHRTSGTAVMSSQFSKWGESGT